MSTTHQQGAQPRPDATYERATRGYDQAHREQLATAIIGAIAEASRLSDVNVIAIRTSEAADALADVLATVLALVPDHDVPSKLRETVERLAKRLRRDLGAARGGNA